MKRQATLHFLFILSFVCFLGSFENEANDRAKMALKKDQEDQCQLPSFMRMTSNRGSSCRCRHTCNKQRQCVSRLPWYILPLVHHVYDGSIFLLKRDNWDGILHPLHCCWMKTMVLHMTIATIPCMTAVFRHRQ